MKTCTKCGAEKPESEFYVKVKATGRLFSWCKECHCRITTAHYQANLEEGREHRKAYGRTHRAEQRAARWRREAADPEKAKAQSKAYYERGKAKRAPKKRVWREANAGRIKTRNAGYRGRNREALRAKARNYYAANREELLARQRAWREANPERAREITAKWRKANPEKVAAKVALRRALLAAAEGSYTAQEWKDLKKAQDYTCLCCKRREPEIKLSPDHVVPISRGGTNWISNIQGLCRTCNIRKHAHYADYRNRSALVRR